MKNTFHRRALSILLTVLMALSGIAPTFSAFAGDGVDARYPIEIFDGDTDTMIPTYDEVGDAYKIYMYEGDTKQLTYKLIDSDWPDNGYVKWYSENPVLVDTDQTGKVKAFDASKGAVIHSWIDNEVKTIPIIGSKLGELIEKIFFNDYIDLDSMDTQEIVDLLIMALGSESWIADYIEAYKGELVDSLRRYLDNINSNIVCQLFSADGTLLTEDKVHVTVLKNENWYAAFLPNGTHITNKSQIHTTQAVGNKVQIYAITTPQRLHFGTVYSVKASSIFSTGKVVATVNDSGLVTFKNKGTATILVSPDSEDVIEGILKLINFFYDTGLSETMDTDKLAQILIDYIGLDINRTVLAGMLDTLLAIYQITQDTASTPQLIATAVEIVANIVLQMVYNDTITFNVVESQPLTSFRIEGVNPDDDSQADKSVASVKEGTQMQLQITDVQPEAGDISDITWSSSNPEIACVDPETGVITGLDAGGSLGNLSTQTCYITATSAANNISRTVKITVTGKTGKYISDVHIKGADIVEENSTTKYTCTIYPERVAESENLYIYWGMKTGKDEDGNDIYEWAAEGEPVATEVGTIDNRGNYTTLGGGTATIAVKAQTGYYLSNGNFYEISSHISTKDIMTGIPIERIQISATEATSNGDLSSPKIVTINGVDYTYYTIKKSDTLIGAYNGNGAKFTASVYPANATDQNLRWVVNNSNFSVDVSNETHGAEIKYKAGHEYADTFNVYAETPDGRVASNVITIAVVRSSVTANTINGDVIELTNYASKNVAHTITAKGVITNSDYTCYKCNWYSSDESIFSVTNPKVNSNGDAEITANDVGEATLYCVSADGAIMDTARVVVKPDKRYLKNIIDLCDNSVIIRTAENKTQYQQYMRKLDLAYAVYYDQDMASQSTCDTYADNLLAAFCKLGGYISIGQVEILATNKKKLSSDHVTVKVGSTSNYKNYSYDFDFKILPETAMCSDVIWKSSNSSISVDKNGKCTPTSNDPCSAKITCTVKDYVGNEVSDSVYVSFARTKATGVTLDTTNIVNAKVGETKQLKATIAPTALGNSTASCGDLIWSSSDEEVATVNESGVITYVYGGDCVITCTTVDGGYTAQCAVNVITNYDGLQLLINQYNDLQLNSLNYYPDTWENFTATMQKAQAMVNRGGYSQKEVEAMKAELKASYDSLKKYNYIQKVELFLDGEETKEFYQYDLSLLKEGISYTNAILDLNVRLYPNNASYKSAKWYSSTPLISVTTDGKCSPTANECCYGRITCVVEDHFGNKFEDSVWVSYAYTIVTALKLSDRSINGLIGETYQLTCAVEPSGISIGTLNVGGASIKDYYWESDDPRVATVSEDGLVTFCDAGSTIIRAVSYDGGVYAECTVSTEGDRSALKAALNDYKDVDYTQYNYDYGMAFTRAYAAAEDALTDMTLTQDEIDATADALIAAYEEMLRHPYINIQQITISYTTYAKPAIGSEKSVESGMIGTSDALSVNLSGSKYSNWNNYNRVTINPNAMPSGASYKSVEWTVNSSSQMDTSQSNSSFTLTPKKQDEPGWADVTVTFTDHYDRKISRRVTIVLADKVCTGISVSPGVLNLKATDAPVSASASLSGSPNVTKINWYSNNTAVATVDSTGVITPVDKGSTTIVAKSVDGGYTASVTVNVQVDYSQLAEKVNEYSNLISNVQSSYEYTEESLAVLSAAVNESRAVVDEGRASQAEVNSYLDTLNAAYNALVRYEPARGITIGVEAGQSNVTQPNDGFIRFTNVSLNNKTIQLVADLQPANAKYTSLEWSSSNAEVTVDQFGLVTSTTAAAKATLITCKVTNVYGEEFTASAYVTFVRFGATAVTFGEEMMFGAPQETKPVKVNLNQTTTTIPSTYINDCIYTSSAPEIASVDEEGNVTFNTQGTAIITVTAIDGGYTGTIEAHTTWDTTALQEALDEAKDINYMNYAYAQGMAFKNAYEAAQAVYADINASQQEIDDACMDLQEAMTDLEGNDFVKPAPTFTSGTTTVSSGISLGVDENSQLTIVANMNNGAMVKSAQWSVDEANGVTAVPNGNVLTVTKTVEENATLSMTYTVVDDYDREYTYSYSINVLNAIINIESIDITVNGVVRNGSYTTSGYKIGYTDFKTIQFGYVTNPTDAAPPVSVTWTSSDSTRITVSDAGVVGIGTVGRTQKTNTAVITCKVENSDGTFVEKSITVTIAR